MKTNLNKYRHITIKRQYSAKKWYLMILSDIIVDYTKTTLSIYMQYGALYTYFVFHGPCR